MQRFDSSHEKVQKICDVLTKETLKPAELRAKEIIDQANLQAAKIIQAAKQEAEKTSDDTKRQLEQEHRAFESSIKLAIQKALQSLRQQVEKEFFAEGFHQLAQDALSDENVLKSAIEALISQFSAQGEIKDLQAFVGQTIDPDKFVSLLSNKVVKTLDGQVSHAKDLKFGVRLVSKDHHLSLELSESSLEELLKSFASGRLREVLFKR